MFGLQVTVEPASEPITLAEAKLNLRVDHSEEDTLITSLIVAARRHCEIQTGRAFISQTLKLTRDAFPDYSGEIRLPRPPLVSVTSVIYTDYAGDNQTLSSSLYVVDASCEPGRIALAYGQIWPETYQQVAGVRVTYVAGYASAALVPQNIKQAMHLLIGHWYTNREAVGGNQLSNAVAMGVDSLLGSAWTGQLTGDFG